LLYFVLFQHLKGAMQDNNEVMAEEVSIGDFFIFYFTIDS